MLHPIVQLGDLVLRQQAQEIPLEEIRSEKIQKLIETMKEIMRAAPGVGLAAPQIGVSLQLVVIEDREELLNSIPPEIRAERERVPVPFHVLINPKLTVTNEEKANFFEGCLSVSGYCRVTPRARNVRVEYLDEKGNKKIINASGWYARILQHEVDHLHGKLYIDISDKRTEIVIDEANRKKWLNASSEKIQQFLKESMKKKVQEQSE